MQDELRARALASWGRILEHPAAWMSAEQQYHELLKVADKMELERLISDVEWRQLVRKAGSCFIGSTGPGTLYSVRRRW